MKQKRKSIPVKTARTALRVMPRREPAHPIMGRLPMSLARALTEPPVPVDEFVEEVETERATVRRRRAA
jgi:hypothetical protein